MSSIRQHSLNAERLADRINPASISFINSSDTVRFDGAPGELNNLTVTVATNGTLQINDNGNLITIDASASGLGFTGGGTSTLSNGNLGLMQKLLFILGDNDDSLVAREIPIRVEALGDEGNDTISIFSGLIAAGNNELRGGSGDDSLTGGSTNDVLSGDSGNDLLRSGDGDDILNGGTGDDTHVGGDGNDIFNGGSGDDDIDGGDGDDTAIGGNGNDTIRGGDGLDSLSGGPGEDQLLGGDGADTLTGNADNDTINGGSATDLLSETINGLATLAPNSLKSDLGTDTLISIDRAFISGSAGNDAIVATTFTGQTTLRGSQGNDLLIGGAGSDVLTGDEGNDTLRGNAGIDILIQAGSANFILTNTKLTGTAGFGIDVLATIEQASLTGGSANDVINASAFTLGSVSLFGGAGNDTLTGGSFGDILDGEGGDNRLIGGAGNDFLAANGSANSTMTGGAGNDSLVGGGGIEIVVESVSGSLSFPSSSTFTGTALGIDQIFNINGFVFTGNTGNNTFDLTNAPTTGITINGGLGIDTVKVVMNAGVTTLSNTLLSIGGGAIALNGIERANLEGGAAANSIDASAFTLGAVTLRGGAANDNLIGGSGSDLLDGGADIDTLIGGPGVDIFQNGETVTQ